MQPFFFCLKLTGAEKNLPVSKVAASRFVRVSCSRID